jgi:UDP-glucose 4-epimerase
VILRYFNVAGATERLGEVHRPETHLIPNVLLAAEGGEALTLFGEDYPTPDGTPIRDYIHVADLADAHVAALVATDPADPRTGPDSGPCEPLICNLGTSTGFSVREVLAVAAEVTGTEIPFTVGPRRAGDPPVLVASNQRARDVLGWEPRRSSLREMVGSAWAWRRAHPDGYGD